ncbi:hypothetical protein [Lentzea sp. CA-135723]|uniref:hypothetical protein n=1 Tax=Lentzea sp. CA-135723 TaxID=3239950 RepID=UPI003D8A4B28
MRNWVSAEATQVTVKFFPDPGGTPLAPGTGYLRLWLAEGFLAQRTSWGNDHYPALYGGVTLNFLGLGNRPTPFSSLTERRTWNAPGAYLDFPMTTLLPYNGGVVEVDAALYRASGDGPLGVAAKVVSGLAGLIGPPLTVAGMIADKVSDGLDSILEAQGDDPVLGLHWSMVADGGGNQTVRPGHIVVVNAPGGELLANLAIVDGRLQADGDLLTGVDYLVVRVETRTERDDFWLPEFEELRTRAAEAYLLNQLETFENLRTTAICRAYTTTDFSRTDGLRLAKLVADRIDEVKQLGAVPKVDRSIENLTSADLPTIEEIRGLGLAALLNVSSR